MKKIVIALPTCGKTYACKYLKHHTNIKTVDYDLRGNKDLLTDYVRNIQTEHVKALFRAGASIIFTHNGALNFNLLDPREYDVDIYIRECTPKQYGQLCVKRGDDTSFCLEAMDKFDAWVEGMWDLFDKLSDLGFHPHMKILGLNTFILDDLKSDKLC